MNDTSYMQEALELARKGAGRVSPNPMVGAVIVKDGKVLARGYHKKFGSHHAEINALKKIGHQAKGATLYVNLEPCHHHGRTPPCVDTVIASGVTRVVIAMKDPNRLTNGKSIKKMRAAGIQVQVGMCAQEAKELNRFFIKHVQKGLPYVIAKVAQSLDGKIATKKGMQTWLTGDESFKYVQTIRSEVDAILVGRETVRIDDPQLNVRDPKRPQPKRVILDSSLKTSLKSRIFKVHGGDVIFFCQLHLTHPRVRAFQRKGITVISLPKKGKHLDLIKILKTLGQMGIASLYVEGGSEVFTSFCHKNIVDEWEFILVPQILGQQAVSAFRDVACSFFQTKGVVFLDPDLLVRFSKKY